MGKYREVTKELKELVKQGKSGKQISEILNLSYTTMHRKLRKLNINLPNYHNELKFNNTVFDSIDNEEKAYWLGFLYADGSVSANNNSVELSLKGEDISHLEKFKTFLNSKNSVKLGIAKCGNKTYSRCRFNASDKHFHDKLIELGCIPNKSLILKFPDINIFASQELIPHFIRGYVDGDGCLTYTKTGRLVVEIIGTKEFLSTIVDRYSKIFTPALHKDKRHLESNTYFISCACNKADEFATLLYANANIYLDRKYDRFAVLRRNS